MMTDDIEDCLSVVFNSLKNCDVPTEKLIAWCSAMLKSDRVGSIAKEQLQKLRAKLGGG